MALPAYVGPPRRFWEKDNSPYNYKFGLGTVHPEGDWCEGDHVIERAVVDGNCMDLRYYEEDLTYFVDVDLLMDEGL
jgi:hypothetical protein